MPKFRTYHTRTLTRTPLYPLSGSWRRASARQEPRLWQPRRSLGVGEVLLEQLRGLDLEDRVLEHRVGAPPERATERRVRSSSTQRKSWNRLEVRERSCRERLQSSMQQPKIFQIPPLPSPDNGDA